MEIASCNFSNLEFKWLNSYSHATLLCVGYKEISVWFTMLPTTVVSLSLAYRCFASAMKYSLKSDYASTRSCIVMRIIYLVRENTYAYVFSHNTDIPMLLSFIVSAFFYFSRVCTGSEFKAWEREREMQCEPPEVQFNISFVNWQTCLEGVHSMNQHCKQLPYGRISASEPVWQARIKGTECAYKLYMVKKSPESGYILRLDIRITDMKMFLYYLWKPFTIIYCISIFSRKTKTITGFWTNN